MPYLSFTEVELRPGRAILSSTFSSEFEADKCIDGDTTSGYYSMCHSEDEPVPWLAIDYGTTVTVQRVEIFNRQDCCGSRTRNVDVRISESTIPHTALWFFTGGSLFGQFRGPATDGQQITMKGVKSCCETLIADKRPPGEAMSGRYVIVQMNNGNDALNLKEVKAFGRTGNNTKLNIVINS